MKIEIKDYKSIANMDMDVSDYTVLAGKNNGGKSNIIKFIRDFLTKDKSQKESFDVIYIPSQDVNADSQCNAGLKTSSFSVAIKPILEKIVSREILQDTIDKFDQSDGKKNFEKRVNDLLADFGVDDKTFGIKIQSDNFDEETIRKLVGAFATDLYRDEPVDLKDIGQGTQRMITAALIMAYSNMQDAMVAGKKIAILFEEPEVFLHPELKLKLHSALRKLSQDGHMVVISTHDPYFIQLSSEDGVDSGKIYDIYRDGPNTQKREFPDTDRSLPFDSHAEINYKIFGLPTPTFFQELYESLKDQHERQNGYKCYHEFDKEMFTVSPLSLQSNELDDKGNQVTYLTKMRHSIAHPGSSPCGQADLKRGIEDLLKVHRYIKAATLVTI